MAEVWAAIGDFFAEYQVLFRILVILVAAVVLNWVLRLVLDRSVKRFVQGVKRAQDVESTLELTPGPHFNARAVQRTRTLGAVGRHVISWTIGVVTLILVLGELGVNLTAILASAGILAAALAFGAQNIVKDFLNGIFMVFEDQLGVGDLITVGQVSGTVEDVGIRITKVRAADGTLWFVRNGEILTLGNASQGWGRAIVDVTVSAECDLELAERTALECAEELLRSPEFASRVTGQPEMLGLESVSGDRATLRLTVRTRPQAQYAVQRELRTLIARRFKELGLRLADETPRQSGGSR